MHRGINPSILRFTFVTKGALPKVPSAAFIELGLAESAYGSLSESSFCDFKAQNKPKHAKRAGSDVALATPQLVCSNMESLFMGKQWTPLT